jgi:hypothetical protein
MNESQIGCIWKTVKGWARERWLTSNHGERTSIDDGVGREDHSLRLEHGAPLEADRQDLTEWRGDSGL